MAIPRLNGIIKALESGKNACVCFQPGDTASAQAVSTEKYDGVVFEMEHGAYDIKSLRDWARWHPRSRPWCASRPMARR
jgi:4-hydroxy-2-oxoheptanedioate aldolase